MLRRTPKTPPGGVAGDPIGRGAIRRRSGRGLPTSSPSANPVGGLEAFCRPPARSSRKLLPLTLTAIGVVYGDIGTSPLYAMRECFFGSHSVPADARERPRRPVADHLLAAGGHLGQVHRDRDAGRQPGRRRHPGADGAAAAAARGDAASAGARRCWASSAPRCSTATA